MEAIGYFFHQLEQKNINRPGKAQGIQVQSVLPGAPADQAQNHKGKADPEKGQLAQLVFPVYQEAAKHKQQNSNPQNGDRRWLRQPPADAPPARFQNLGLRGQEAVGKKHQVLQQPLRKDQGVAGEVLDPGPLAE